MRTFDHIDEFIMNFHHLDPETILNEHMATRINDGENGSGLSMGKIFAFKIYVTSHNNQITNQINSH